MVIKSKNFRKIKFQDYFICILEEAFDPSDGEDSYQRQYVISVANKVEDCYYIERVRVNQIINFHFVVSRPYGRLLIKNQG